MPASTPPAATRATPSSRRASRSSRTPALVTALLILPALLSCGVHLLVCPAQPALPDSVAAWVAPVCSSLGGAQLTAAALLSQLSDRAQQASPEAHAAAAQLFSQAQTQAGDAARRALAFVSVDLPAHAAAVVQQLPDGVQQGLARSQHLVSQILAAAYGSGGGLARTMLSAPAKVVEAVEEPVKESAAAEEPVQEPAAAEAAPEVGAEVGDSSI